MERVFDSVVLQHILTLDITNINALIQVCKTFHRNITKNIRVMGLAYAHYKVVIEDRVDTHIKRALDVNNNDNKIISLIYKPSIYDPGTSQSIALTFDTQAYHYPMQYSFSANPSQISSMKQLVKLRQVHNQIQKYNPEQDPYEYDTTHDLLSNFFDIPEVKYTLDPTSKPPKKGIFSSYSWHDIFMWLTYIVLAILLGVGLGRLLAFIF